MLALPSYLTCWLQPFSLGVLAALFVQLPGKAAENIFLTYGPIKLTVKVESLQKFVSDGTIDDNLGFLFNLVGASDTELTKLREVMQIKPDLDPLILSRFFNTTLGEDILARAGYVLNYPWGGSGKYGIRAGLLQAALDPGEGLTLMNFIKKFPTDIHLEGEILDDRARAVELLVRAAEHFVAEMAVLSAAEAKAYPPLLDFSQLPDPTEPGPYGVAPKQTWHLTDESRDRRLYVDVYRPRQWRSGQTPVAIVSHGLASRPEDFDVIAKKLASYGFVVALPQHPGSDYLQAQALLEGYSRKAYLVSDFIDRPKDISFVIDELERRNAIEFENRLNLEEVGVGGHSFGGYTALAVAGAEIDWEYLQSECEIGKSTVPNTALLLQCDALTLPREDYQFRDPRVSAVVAANPVNSEIFGIRGLQKVTLPTVLMGGSYDPATPFVLEQARSFPRLGSEEKYLTMAEGQAHVDISKLDVNVTNLIQSLDKVTLPDPNLLHAYGAAVIVPFLLVHIARDETYRPFLNSGAAYSELLSENQKFKFYLITQKSEGALIKEIDNFRRANGITPPPNEFPHRSP